MQYALVNKNTGIVENIITYDGVSKYKPPGGKVLKQVNDWIQMGDHEDMPAPPIPTPPEAGGN